MTCIKTGRNYISNMALDYVCSYGEAYTGFGLNDFKQE
jgi:hypothetical protein